MLSHVSKDWPEARWQTKTARTPCAPRRWPDPFRTLGLSARLYTLHKAWPLTVCAQQAIGQFSLGRKSC